MKQSKQNIINSIKKLFKKDERYDIKEIHAELKKTLDLIYEHNALLKELETLKPLTDTPSPARVVNKYSLASLIRLVRDLEHKIGMIDNDLDFSLPH